MKKRLRNSLGNVSDDEMRGGDAWVWGVALLSVLIIFGHVIGYDFVVWDDGINVYENPHFLRDPLGNITFFWEQAFHKLYIPVIYTVWALAAAVSLNLTGALDAGLFHALNILFHFLNGLLVFRILQKIIPAVTPWASLVGMLLFLFHPLQVEAVCWVTGFKDVFSSSLALASIFFFCHYLDYDGQSIRKGRAQSPDKPFTINGPGLRRAAIVPMESGLWQARLLRSTRQYTMYWALAGAWIFYVVGLLSKPSLVCIGPVLMVIWCWRRGMRLKPELIWIGLLFAIPAIAAILWTRNAQTVIDGNHVPPVMWRPLVALDALTFYAWKVIWPFGMSIDYGRTPHAVIQNTWLWLTAGVPIVVGLILSLVGKARRYGVLALLWGIMLLPYLGLMPFYFQNISTVADRYHYLAMLPWSMLAAWLLSGSRNRFLKIGLPIPILIVLAVSARVETGKWENSGQLFRSALEKNSESWLGNVNYGSHLADVGQRQEADKYYRKAIEINPRFYGSRVAYGQNLIHLNEPERALEQFEYAAQLDPNNASVQMHLGIAHSQLGDTALGITHFENAIRLDPRLFDAYLNLGLAYKNTGTPAKAEELYLALLTTFPERQEPLDYLADLYLEGDRLDEAMVYTNRLLKVRASEDAYLRKGHILFMQNKPDEAAQVLRGVLDNFPASHLLRNNLSWYISQNETASKEAHDEAVSLARSAIALAPELTLDYLDTLVEACVTAGRKSEAIEEIDRAMKNPGGGLDAEQLQKLRLRVEAGKTRE